MEVEKVEKVFPYIMILIFCSLVFLTICNNLKTSKNLKNKKYYLVENRDFLIYLKYFLLLIFFDVPLFVVILLEGMVLEIMLIILGINVLFITLFIFASKETILFKIEKEEIIKKGIKLDGIIIDEYMGQENTGTKIFSMIVEYMENGEKKNYITPYVQFRFFELRSMEVDVYVYNDKVFVTNFKLK